MDKRRLLTIILTTIIAGGTFLVVKKYIASLTPPNILIISVSDLHYDTTPENDPALRELVSFIKKQHQYKISIYETPLEYFDWVKRIAKWPTDIFSKHDYQTIGYGKDVASIHREELSSSSESFYIENPNDYLTHNYTDHFLESRFDIKESSLFLLITHNFLTAPLYDLDMIERTNFVFSKEEERRLNQLISRKGIGTKDLLLTTMLFDDIRYPVPTSIPTHRIMDKNKQRFIDQQALNHSLKDWEKSPLFQEEQALIAKFVQHKKTILGKTLLKEVQLILNNQENDNFIIILTSGSRGNPDKIKASYDLFKKNGSTKSPTIIIHSPGVVLPPKINSLYELESWIYKMITQK